ncbi:MAG: UDP-3-O-(3-hydroxymyristoyl)glucosamine N-acyltransferase [Deltaproteobacteria bacterium]|nr:MAG: UDP-3-O-(3-hydroxymyristoyl)glucosamine N-acyltransferase [Deltaproteobacteria bacterium]
MKTYPLAVLAEKIAGTLSGDPAYQIRGIAAFDDAGPDALTFADGPAYLARVPESDAGAVIVPDTYTGEGRRLIRCASPRAAFYALAELFQEADLSATGIHPTAVVGSNVRLGHAVSIGPYVTIDDDAEIGDHARIMAHTTIGRSVRVGENGLIYPHVTILDQTRIGDRVIIHAGTVIGSDGFGFVPENDRWRKIPHTGIVQIDDDVELGAANTIDRGTFGRTWIQEGVKTDNQVHIAHNVTVGAHTLLVAQVGIAGSATIGHHAILAGKAGIAGHLKVGDRVTIGPMAGVTQSIPDHSVVSGVPEMPHPLWLKVQRILPRLPMLRNQVRDLAKRLDRLEKGNN